MFEFLMEKKTGRIRRFISEVIPEKHPESLSGRIFEKIAAIFFKGINEIPKQIHGIFPKLILW